MRTTSVHSVLLRVMLAGALPVWLASAVLIYQLYMQRYALVERDTGATAHALMVAVDRDLASAQAMAMSFASSPSLRERDPAAAYAQAVRILHVSSGSYFALYGPTGQQLFNTLRPYSEPLPEQTDRAVRDRVFATAQPVISGLYDDDVARQPGVSVNVPVVRNGQVIYDLSLGIFADRLAEMLRREQLPAGWSATILDGNGAVVAQAGPAAAADQLGREARSPELVRHIAYAGERGVHIQMLAGMPVTAVFCRSTLSGWTVAIGVPSGAISSLLWGPFAWTAAGTFWLLVLSLALERLLGARITVPIRKLVEAVRAKGRGEAVHLPPLGLAEADRLASALTEGWRLLEERTTERDALEWRRQQALLAKQLAEEAARGRSAYFAYLSHELRTPLMAILGCAELIEHRTHTTSQDQRALEYCGRIHAGVDQLSEVIDEILDYAKYEAGEFELHQEPMDIEAEVREVVGLLEGRAAHGQVRLRCAFAPDLPPLFADPGRLRQVLMNLLSNALKFTPPDGEVVVSVTRDDAMLAIRVQDSGIGIGPDHLQRVLQPFGQAPNAHAGSAGGTGLGLPLCKALVELHGGTFVMESIPGIGTTIGVRLPIVPAASLRQEPGNRSAHLDRYGSTDPGAAAGSYATRNETPHAPA